MPTVEDTIGMFNLDSRSRALLVELGLRAYI